MKQSDIIPSKYVTQLQQFVDVAQITKEFCETQDKFELDYRTDNAKKYANIVEESFKMILLRVENKMLFNTKINTQITKGIIHAAECKTSQDQFTDFQTFIFKYAAVKESARSTVKLKEYHEEYINTLSCLQQLKDIIRCSLTFLNPRDLVCFYNVFTNNIYSLEYENVKFSIIERKNMFFNFNKEIIDSFELSKYRDIKLVLKIQTGLGGINRVPVFARRLSQVQKV